MPSHLVSWVGLVPEEEQAPLLPRPLSYLESATQHIDPLGRIRGPKRMQSLQSSSYFYINWSSLTLWASWPPNSLGTIWVRDSPPRWTAIESQRGDVTKAKGADPGLQVLPWDWGNSWQDFLPVISPRWVSVSSSIQWSVIWNYSYASCQFWNPALRLANLNSIALTPTGIYSKEIIRSMTKKLYI